MNHNETKTLPYSAAQMYALVMDIERYSEFLPWCLGCRIAERKDTEVLADMVVGYKIFREKFRSRVKFVDGREIHVEYLDGPLRHLKNDWVFRDVSSSNSIGCHVDFHIDFEFSNRLLQSVAESFFEKALGHMMDAFEKRAAEVYPGVK